MPAQTASQLSSDAAVASAAAAAYQAQQARVSQAAVIGAVAAWRLVDGKNLDLSWIHVAARMLAVISGAQRKAAASVPGYLERVLRAQHVASQAGTRLLPDAFAGLTGDGRPLQSLLYAPVALSKQRIGQGERIADVLRDESKHVALLARTVTQDAQRMALQTAMAAEPAIRGYVRQVNLPACARCIILSGRFYRKLDGFLRHPNCDCTMIPARGEEWVETEDPAELIARMRADHPAKLRRSLTEGDLKALEHGADLNQVVNAHRGMATAAGPGRRIKVTREGTTKRGFAGQRLIREAGSKRGSGRYSSARTPRLTPAQVFEEADIAGWDETEITRQLKRFGYLI